MLINKSLYIKPSAVISRYLSSARTLLSKYLRSIQNSQAIFNQPPLIAVKEWKWYCRLLERFDINPIESNLFICLFPAFQAFIALHR